MEGLKGRRGVKRGAGAGLLWRYIEDDYDWL